MLLILFILLDLTILQGIKYLEPRRLSNVQRSFERIPDWFRILRLGVGVVALASECKRGFFKNSWGCAHFGCPFAHTLRIYHL